MKNTLHQTSEGSTSAILFDLETNGLLQEVTKIHCGVVLPIRLTHSGEWEMHSTPQAFRPHQISALVAELQQANLLVGHNITGYDLPALWKVNGDWNSVPDVLDTLVVSRFLWPERYGGHGLGAWGERLGNQKIEYDKGWEDFNEEMLVYCEQDVMLNFAVLKELEKEYKEQQHGSALTGYSIY